jgi:hypothetical protein
VTMLFQRNLSRISEAFVIDKSIGIRKSQTITWRIYQAMKNIDG